MGFATSDPPLRRKQWAVPVDEQDGVIDLGGRGWYYTRLDQALLLWVIAILIMFFTAQFYAFDWHQQARLWSGLSLLVLVSSSRRAWPWAVAKQVRWIVYWWSGLILLGLGLTDYGVYGSVVPILINLCPLWLGLCALGYGVTAVGMGSRSLLGIMVLQLLGLGLLPLWPAWPFAITGGVMASSLLILAQLQWDHR